jgi:hypothetical protein
LVSPFFLLSQLGSQSKPIQSTIQSAISLSFLILRRLPLLYTIVCLIFIPVPPTHLFQMSFFEQSCLQYVHMCLRSVQLFFLHILHVSNRSTSTPYLSPAFPTVS